MADATSAGQPPGEGGEAEKQAENDSVILAGLETNPAMKSIREVMVALRTSGKESKGPADQATSVGLPATFSVPTGSDFYINSMIIVGVAILLAYITSAGIAFLWALVNMMMKNCGQDFWKTDGDAACNAKMVNALVLSIELRCFDNKPSSMLQEDFDDVCSGFWIEVAVNVFVFLVTIGSILYSELGKLASKVTFHENLFVVESWHGRLFQCSFFADVIQAKSTSSGLEITSKARVRTETDGSNSGGGGGFFGRKKKEQILTINGDATMSVLAGSSEAKCSFLQEFAKRLPVSIEGFDGVAEVDGATEARASASSASCTSLLEGRLGSLLAARRGEGDRTTARKPISCDFYVEVLFIVLIAAVGYYCFSVLTNIIGWAMATGRGKCSHEMKPDVDLCDFVRVFSPIELPLVAVEEYVNIAGLAVACIVYPIWTFMNLPFEYRFHGEVVEELLFAGWESQASTMIFQGDIEGLELVWGSLEKYIKAKISAIYTVKQGVTKPFEITAKFSPQMEMKIGLVDNDCASCSGHGTKALSYKESVMRALNAAKPGLLQMPAEEARMEA